MNLDDDAKLYLYWDAVLSFDPTTSTAELQINNVRYPMTWLGTPVFINGKWYQTAKTNQLFRGSSADDANSPVALPPGRYTIEPIVSIGSQIVSCQLIEDVIVA